MLVRHKTNYAVSRKSKTIIIRNMNNKIHMYVCMFEYYNNNSNNNIGSGNKNRITSSIPLPLIVVTNQTNSVANFL